jgi:hypothetical protein
VPRKRSQQTKLQVFNSIAAGSRVRILVPNGIGLAGLTYRVRTGRAVLKGPHGWVLNMGGRYGTPAVATVENIVSVIRERKAK